MKRIFLSCAIHLTKCFIVSDLSKKTANDNIVSCKPGTMKEEDGKARDTGNTLLLPAHASTSSESWSLQLIPERQHQDNCTRWLSTSGPLSLLTVLQTDFFTTTLWSVGT